jgi:glycosyltransferase involved in cell wall biosynthesis
MASTGRPGGRGDQLLGVLVTYRRTRMLGVALERLAEQQRPVDELLVVDNSPSAERERLVDRYRARGRRVHYVAARENLGPAGAVALAMRRLLETASDEDWILLLDDGEPPGRPETLAEMHQFASRMRRQDPRLGAVGAVGATFDWARGRIIRIPDDQLVGPVLVDYIGSGQLPLYRVAAVRAVGPFLEELFFGFEELEYGLRLRAAGWMLYVDGDRWRAGRALLGRLEVSGAPSLHLPEGNWRQYYGLRNLLHILVSDRRYGAAVRVTLLTGLAKPLANLPKHPHRSLSRLVVNWRACRDGWTGRLGRTVEPDVPADGPADQDQDVSGRKTS